jgi:hypothetical protein
MSLQTFVLSQETASLPIGPLLENAGKGGVEIRDPAGRIIAFILPPDDDQAWAYAEASLDISRHREEILAAMQRRTGVTTEELLENAEREGEIHDLGQALNTVSELIQEKVEELKSRRRPENAHDQAAPKAKAG